MKENIFDEATDILKERVRDVGAEFKRRYGKTKPYRKEPVPKEDLLYDYNQMDGDMELSLRQSMGDEIMDDYVRRMEKLKGGSKK